MDQLWHSFYGLVLCRGCPPLIFVFNTCMIYIENYDPFEAIGFYFVSKTFSLKVMFLWVFLLLSHLLTNFLTRIILPLISILMSTSGFCTILLKRLYHLLFKPCHGLLHCCHVLWLSGRKMSWLSDDFNSWRSWAFHGKWEWITWIHEPPETVMVIIWYLQNTFGIIDLFPVLRLSTHKHMVFIHFSWFWVGFIRIW